MDSNKPNIKIVKQVTGDANQRRRNVASIVKPSSDTRLPSWYDDPESFYFKGDDCRAKCADCLGRGTLEPAGIIAECAECWEGMPCGLHQCRSCEGAGAVCPACRGMRFLRLGGGRVGPCEFCTEGNNFNGDVERGTIRRYMLRYDIGQRPGVGMRRDDDMPEKPTPEQVAEYRAHWVANHGDARSNYKRRASHTTCEFCGKPPAEQTKILPHDFSDGRTMYLCQVCRFFAKGVQS